MTSLAILPTRVEKKKSNKTNKTRKISKGLADTYPTALAAPNARIPPLSALIVVVRVLHMRVRVIKLIIPIIRRGLVFGRPEPRRGDRRAGIRVGHGGAVLHRPDRPLALPDGRIRLASLRRRTRRAFLPVIHFTRLGGSLSSEILVAFHNLLCRDFAVVAEEIGVVQQRENLIRHLDGP